MGGLGNITLENSTLLLGGPGGIQPTLDWLFVLPPGSEGERPRVGSPCFNRPRWILTGSQLLLPGRAGCKVQTVRERRNFLHSDFLPRLRAYRVWALPVVPAGADS